MADKLKKLDRLIMRKAKVMKLTGIMNIEKLSEEISKGMEDLGITNEEVLAPESKFKFKGLISKSYKGLEKVKEEK